MRPVLTLLLTLALTSTASLSSAASKRAPQASQRAPEPPATDASRATDAIDRELIGPLAQNEDGRSRYSRAMIPPHLRTARILDAAPRADADGNRFLTLSFDETRPGDKVRKDTIGGCVYPDSGKVFVGRDGAFFPAALLLGKKVDAVAGVCAASDEASSNGKRSTGWLAALRAKL